ncbi:MAG: peptidase M14 family protein [Candidatus Bathyarchaeota archaeon]|nr:MAG: peptidase M14 family protein [Candidatus Bathyarchaeota archaeon]
MTDGISSPEEFFGHKMGADRKLVRWERIVEYFCHLDKSPCVKVTDLGPSTEGNLFLLVIVSSPENLKKADEIREMSYSIAHPEGLSEEQVERIIREGKTVVTMSMSIHATEVGGTQMAPELCYEVATSPELEEVRQNTVLLVFPCFNPDGQIMVTDWYDKYLDTEYEGVRTPFLYHKYTGHDNNRDAIHLSQAESRMVSKVMYREWYPQAYIDHHHMGSYGARFYIPPFTNPIDPNVDPLIWTEQQLYGGMMATMLEAAGKTGVESAATYPGEFMPTFNYIPCWHNICGMLTESASAKLATPHYVHHHQLKPSRRGRPEYRTQMGFPHPWSGGWWRLRDIVEQQKISAIATLKVAARFRELILRNMYTKAMRSIEAGKSRPPYAFVVKPEQHDELTAYKFMKLLTEMGVTVSRSRREFKAEGVTYPRGTFVIFTAQSCRPYIISLLKRTFYHAGPFSFRPDGTPISPYDLCTYNISEFMGVALHEVEEPLAGDFEDLTSVRFPRGRVDDAPHGYLLDCIYNDSFAAVNRLLRRGIEVHRIREPVEAGDRTYGKGSFYIPAGAGIEEELRRLSRRLHLIFGAAPSTEFAHEPARMLRIGMYQRYWGGNMDEGWTRWLLERYRFRYRTMRDADIKRGRLIRKYDVIILPSDHKSLITGEGIEEYFQKRFRGLFTIPNLPEEYRSGIGKEGVEKLKEFVEDGGVLVTLGQASNFAIEELGLPVKNVLSDLKPADFLCPGSTLHVNVNKEHPLTWGVVEDLLIIFRNHPAFEVKPGASNEEMEVVLSYPDERIMESGWLIGEKHLSRKAALIEAKKGDGRIILFGFSPQFRAQSDAAFKLFFNGLIG